jgi:hypothetical protein
MDKLRSIEVSAPIPNIKCGSKGYFHRWCNEPYFDGSLNYPLQKTFALIEFLDGSIKFMEPETIKFTEPYQNFSKAS